MLSINHSVQFGTISTNSSSTRTAFPNLGGSAEKNYPGVVEKERQASGLDTISNLVDATRHWFYWSINVKNGKRLPVDVALELNRKYGEDVRAFGYSGGMDETMLQKWMKPHYPGGPAGIGRWDVDTKEGLSALVDLLKSNPLN